MTHMDFLSLLSCIAGPVLSNPDGEINLPVIWAITEPKLSPALITHRINKSTESTKRLDDLVKIALVSDNVPFCCLGDVSMIEVSSAMKVYQRRHSLGNDQTHDQTTINELLVKSFQATAQTTPLKYLHVDSFKSRDFRLSTSTTNLSANLASLSSNQQFPPASGFTFAFWMRLPPLDVASDCSFGSDTSRFSSTSTSNSHNSSFSTQHNKTNHKTSIRSKFDDFYLYIFSIVDENNNFFTVRFDCAANKFSIYTSCCSKNQHQFFRSSKLSRSNWHHVGVTYTPPKRMLSKKASVNLYLDGILVEVSERSERALMDEDEKYIRATTKQRRYLYLFHSIYFASSSLGAGGANVSC